MQTMLKASRVCGAGRRLVLSCVAALGILPCGAQTRAVPPELAQLDHTSWTARDGAPLGVFFIQQDSDGTLWIGAEGGLYTFNGVAFAPFQTQQGELPLPAMRITMLHMAKDGSLWVGFAIGGIARITNHRVIRVYGADDGLPIGAISEITEAPDGTIFAIARDQLFQLHADRWKDVQAASSVPGGNMRDAFFDRAGNLWIAANGAVWKLSVGEHQFAKTKEPAGLSNLFAQAHDGSIWLRYNNPGPASGAIRRLVTGEMPGLPGVNIPGDASTLFFDSAGFLWIATVQQGVLRLPTDNLPVAGANVLHRPSDHFGHLEGLTSDNTNGLFEDSSGDMWVGTANGLDRFRAPHLLRFLEKRTSQQTVLTACPSDGLWIANQDAPPVSIEGSKVQEHGPVREPVFAHCDANGTLWLSELQGLWRYRSSGIDHIPPPAGVPAINNREVVGNNDHLLYASYTRNGLWKFVDGSWSHVVVPGLPSDTPFSLSMDHGGRLWAGFIDNRVGMLDGSVGHTFTGDKAHPLGAVEVFLESRFGMLVGGAEGIAAVVGDHLQSLLVADPVTAMGVSGLLQASNGDLWLNTLHGIVRIRAAEVTQALRFSDYRMRSEVFAEAGIAGPSPQVFQLPTAVEDSHGLFWFVTSNTVVSLDPDAIRGSMTPPVLRVTSATVDGQPLDRNHKVSPGYHTLRIDYFGAYLTAPEKVSYKYKLEGIDKDWQDVGDRSEAVFTGLRPGSYKFAVIASNGEGTWSKPDESLQFTVTPSFSETPTFLFLCIFFTAVLLASAFRLRIRYVANAVRQRSEARADERIRIARDLHDTLLQGIQGLMLRFHVASLELPEGSRTRVSMESALATAERIVVEGRNRVNRLRLHDFDDISLHETFRTLATELNGENKITFAIKTEGIPKRLAPLALQELCYIGREAISNAFRHADASEIVVGFTYEEKSFVLSVSDNGRGFDSIQQARKPRPGHWGLPGMHERARTVAARFDCLSAQGKGTQVLVTVPSRSAYGKRPAKRTIVHYLSRLLQRLTGNSPR